MSSNVHYNGGDSLTVLYKVVNSDCDVKGGLYNALQIPRAGSVTLAAVKKHCVALNHLNHLGADGFHWRVCIEDKQQAGIKSPIFSWWDIQDENARLPVKEYSMSQAETMFMPPKVVASSTMQSTTKGALKGLGKAIAGAVEGSHTDHGPRVPIIAFKLLDLVKMHDDFALKHGGSKGHGHGPVTIPQAPKPRAQQRAPAQPQRTPAPPQRTSAQPQRTPAPQQRQQPAATPAQRPASQRQAPRPAEASLMDFGAPAPAAHRGIHHSSSMPASVSSNETRAEKLKREYAEKSMKANRVWDDVDQRWVEVDPKGGVKAGSQSAPPQAANATTSKLVGIKLDGSSAVGKSANVQAAVGARINEMRQSQQKAVTELRERENKKKLEDAEEDEVRKRLEPKIKAWSEEHGKKKQLRALLASLHTILWPGAKWKQIGIGDLLDDNKVKRAFLKSTLVVHPDKTHDLDAEKRFLAKRIFDALSQAKTEFDNTGR